MTKQETQILTEVANDIKWLKGSATQLANTTNTQLNKIESHLSELNGAVKNNTVNIGKNQTAIKWLWRIVGGLCGVGLMIIGWIFRLWELIK